MAHNIHINKEANHHNFFSVQEKPWHGLGKVVKDYPVSKEALEFAGLNFEVEKEISLHFYWCCPFEKTPFHHKCSVLCVKRCDRNGKRFYWRSDCLTGNPCYTQVA